jgi:DNA polymerase
MFLALDFETYYDQDYSLRKMTTREYIMSDDFEVTCCAIKACPTHKNVANIPTVVVKGPHLPVVLASIPWDSTIMLCHNTPFDAAILAWIYGHRPKFHLDSMAMAQAQYGHNGRSVALERLAPLVGRVKNTNALANMKGVRASQIDWASEAARLYVDYAKGDADTSLALFRKMVGEGFPSRELVIIDILTRMYVDGQLELDRDILSDHLDATLRDIEFKIQRSGYPISRLRSRAQFGTILTENGYPVPEKISERTGESTYAFAKDDPEFAAMLVDPDQRLRELCEARLAASSSIERTRTERFINVYDCSPDPIIHVPLKYSAAHTHRFGGRDKLNVQNLGQTSPIRTAIHAREDHLLVVADASQIEARLTGYLAGETALCAAFGRGEDVYATFAGMIYGRPINKTDDPLERRVGKTGVLGLGFGCGASKFQHLLATMAKTKESVIFCLNVVNTYRSAYPGIPRLWRHGDWALQMMASYTGDEPKFFGPCRIGRNHLVLPSGLRLDYPGLKLGQDGWTYTHPTYGEDHSIWGGTITENVVQALDHIVITNAMIEMDKFNRSWHCALQVHDELIYDTPEDEAEHCLKVLTKALSRTPTWADETLQLAAEGIVVKRYGDAK